MHAWDVQSKRELLRINAGLSTFSRSSGGGKGAKWTITVNSGQYVFSYIQHDHCKLCEICIFVYLEETLDSLGEMMCSSQQIDICK